MKYLLTSSVLKFKHALKGITLPPPLGAHRRANCFVKSTPPHTHYLFTHAHLK